jgi:hypothetical protein
MDPINIAQTAKILLKDLTAQKTMRSQRATERNRPNKRTFLPTTRKRGVNALEWRGPHLLDSLDTRRKMSYLSFCD